MIHLRIDNHNSTAVDIYVNISQDNMMTTSSPIPFKDCHTNENQYDRLFETNICTPKQSKIVKNRKDYSCPMNKKHYTLKQVLDNVDTIQKQYEQVVNHRTKPISTPTCFFTFKQLTKLLKNLRTIKTKTDDDSTTPTQYSEIKSPFTFGGETLQWIALPQNDSHIYENAFIE